MPATLAQTQLGRLEAVERKLAARASDADKLDALIMAATRARGAAMVGKLWDRPQCIALLNAAYDLFQCDELYDTARSLGVTFGIDPDGSVIDFGERRTVA